MRRLALIGLRRYGQGLLLAGVLTPAVGCGLLPTREDLGSAVGYCKDQVTGKARRDRLTKNFSEARILERRKDFVGAAKLYREVLAEEPQSRDCHHRLGVMSAVQGKFDEAHAHYRAALDCGSPTADLWSDVGYCHYMQHQMPEAEGALRQALALEPQHRTALNNLAMVVGEQGNLDAAYQLFRQANSEAEAECNFAYLCGECGDLLTAQQHFSRALSLDPTMKPAAEALLQVTAKLQELQQLQEHQTAMAAAAGATQQAGGPASAEAATGGVRQAAHQATDERPATRPLIEVFTGGPRSAAASAAVAQASQAARAPASQPSPSGAIPANYNGPQAPGPTQPMLLHPAVGGTSAAGRGNAAASPALPNASAGNAPVNTAPVNNAPVQTVHPAAVNPTAVQPATLPPSSGLSPFTPAGMPQPQYLQPSTTPPTQRAGMAPQNAAPPPSAEAGPFPSLVR